MKTYKLTISLVVQMSDEVVKYYAEHEPDLHEAIATSEKACVEINETTDNPVETWS